MHEKISSSTKGFENRKALASKWVRPDWVVSITLARPITHLKIHLVPNLHHRILMLKPEPWLIHFQCSTHERLAIQLQKTEPFRTTSLNSRGPHHLSHSRQVLRHLRKIKELCC
ncbi:hypothetical protein AAZV13_13G117000 [Glycine max]